MIFLEKLSVTGKENRKIFEFTKKSKQIFAKLILFIIVELRYLRGAGIPYPYRINFTFHEH